MSLPTSPRSIRFRRPSSPLRFESIVEGHEPEDEQVTVSKFTTNPDVQSDLRPRLSLRPLTHRTSKPLPSILKRKARMTEEREDELYSSRDFAHCFEISLIRYSTSCCESIVCLEHISDWIHETLSDVYRCPSCMLPCILNALHTIPNPSQSQALFSVTGSLGPNFERVLSLARALFEQQYAKIRFALSSPPSKCQSVSTYRSFGTDDGMDPETEFKRILSSSFSTTYVMETSMRLLSITGLTLVLFALLSQ
ncbi:hypothetical protein C0989_008252 [Termitomyces sp. Mn162]|nr:hypothetical protein C0989_008252 [Termitomyces sp. Mn162]